MLGDILEEDFSIPQALSKFQKNQHGKPIIENAGLHFNISHSNDMVVVAICKKASLGIDIQLEKRFSSKLLPKVFTDSEQEAFKTSPNQSSFFFDIWSKKEAAVKATGKGIKTGLSSFSVLKNKIELDQHHLHLEKITLKKGYSAAVAVNHPISKITIKPFSHEV